MDNWILWENKKPPIETPIWVKTNTGLVYMAACHNNGMGATGPAKVDYINGKFYISDTVFYFGCKYWQSIPLK